MYISHLLYIAISLHSLIINRNIIYKKVKLYFQLYKVHTIWYTKRVFSCYLPAVSQQDTIPQCLMLPLKLGAQPRGPKDVGIMAGPWPAGIHTDELS